MLIGHPLRPAIVAVEHRGDRVDAQPVEVILVQPEERAVDQELAHLVAGVVEDLGAPLLVLADPVVGVFVERRAVEVDQAVVVLGEVRRHPVQDDADVALVEMIHEVLEVVRRAEAAGRRKIAGDLIAPRRIERVLGDGQQLDMGVALLLHIGGQPLGQIAIGQVAVGLGHAHPGTEVHLVDRHRAGQEIGLGPLRQPGGVAPGVLVDVPHDGGRLGAHLRKEALGIGLLDQGARLRLDLVLVERALAQLRDEQLPDAGAAALAHRVRPAVPAVEVADDADALGVGRPDGEDDARRRRRA